MYKHFSKKYDEWATFYDPQKVELKTILNNVPLNNKRVLDIGCGTGRLSFLLSPYVDSLLGIDVDKQSIDFCNQKKAQDSSYEKCVFACADILNYFSEDKFDIVFFSWSLYQTNDMETAIINAKKALTPFGKLVILQPISGQQDAIFDIEVKRTNKHYDQIIDKQLLLCDKHFTSVNTEDIITEFVYPSIDCAIRANAFFYELFSGGITQKICDDLKRQLMPCVDANGYVHVSDITKIIVCSL